MNLYYVAAIWIGMALLASMVSIRIALPVALVEIVVGALAGNIPGIKEHVQQTSYTTFLASIGSVLLTFLAGAEIDPVRCASTGRRVSPSASCPSSCLSGGPSPFVAGRCTGTSTPRRSARPPSARRRRPSSTP